jgi:glycosyltransferase involved in cell wall biosynthesis
MPMLRCLPAVQHRMLGEIFRLAEISVSPSEHDGTPNTLIEAMACGCLPVAGDIESVREWVDPGANGLLFNPRDPVSIAETVLKGLADEGLRRRARESNPSTVANRANRRSVAEAARAAYGRLLSVA